MILARLKRKAGFTLMEMIGVMAIMSILAAVLAPNIIDAIHRGYAEAEEQNLLQIANSLQRSVLQNKQIPSSTTASWVTAVASESAFNTQQVEFNPRDFRRRLIFDPRFFSNSDTVFGGFTQNQGLASPPVSARAMLISDLTRNVPAIANNASTFNSIWDQSGSPSIVEGADVKIQRINMNGWFHRIIFNNQRTASPAYQLETGTLTSIPAASGGSDGSLIRYVLTDTRVGVHQSPFPGGVLSMTSLVQGDQSLRYQTDGLNWSWVRQ